MVVIAYKLTLSLENAHESELQDENVNVREFHGDFPLT